MTTPEIDRNLTLFNIMRDHYGADTTVDDLNRYEMRIAMKAIMAADPDIHYDIKCDINQQAEFVELAGMSRDDLENFDAFDLVHDTHAAIHRAAPRYVEYALAEASLYYAGWAASEDADSADHIREIAFFERQAD